MICLNRSMKTNHGGLEKKWDFIENRVYTGEVWDNKQERILSSPDDFSLILAPAGSGKTVLLAEIAARRSTIKTSAERNNTPKPSKVLALLNNRRQSSSFRDQVTARTKNAISIIVSTFHGLCLEIIKDCLKDNAPKLLLASEQMDRIKSSLDLIPPDLWPDKLTQALKSLAFRDELQIMITALDQLQLDVEKLFSSNTPDILPKDCIIKFIKNYRKALKTNNEIDYSGAVTLALALLSENNNLQKFQEKFHTILIDDLHNMEPGLIPLLKLLIGPKTKLICSIDPMQNVESFRRHNEQIALDFIEAFPQTTIHNLDYNYRNSRSIHELCQKLASPYAYSNGLGKYPNYLETETKDREANPNNLKPNSDSNIYAWHAAQEEKMAKAIVCEIKRLVQEGYTWQDFAIIYRTHGKQVTSLINELIAAEIPISVPKNDLVLIENPEVCAILQILKAAGGDHSPQLLQNILHSPYGKVNIADWENINYQLAENNLSFSNYLANKKYLVDKDSISLNDTELTIHEIDRVIDLIDSVHEKIIKSEPVIAILDYIWQQRENLSELQELALGNSTEALLASQNIDAVIALFAWAKNNYPKPGLASIKDFLNAVYRQEVPTDFIQENRYGFTGVRISSISNALGKEWPIVFVLGLNLGEWPKQLQKSSLLKTERLQKHGWNPPISYREQIKAEKKSLYVAISRAKERLYLTSIKNSESEISWFIDYLGLPKEVAPEPDIRFSAEQLIIELRKVVTGKTDDSLNLRQAAANELAELAKLEFLNKPALPLADPKNWWGNIKDFDYPRYPTNIKLSGSIVEKLLKCPRSFLLEKIIEDYRSGKPALDKGILVHKICELIQLEDEIDWQELLQNNWLIENYQSIYESEIDLNKAKVCINNFLGWLTCQHRKAISGKLPKLYAEVPFSFPYENNGNRAVIAGRIDLIEVLDEKIIIWDLKSGSNPNSYREHILDLPQLGIYQMAVELGCLDKILGFKAAGNILSAGIMLLGATPKNEVKKYIKTGLISTGQGFPTLIEQPAITDAPWPVKNDEIVPSYSYLCDPDLANNWIEAILNKSLELVASANYHTNPNEDWCKYCVVNDSCPVAAEGLQVLSGETL